MLAAFLSLSAPAQSLPEIQLHTAVAGDPWDDGVVVLSGSLPSGEVVVTLLPPVRGSLSVPFAWPDVWQANRDGSVSAILPVSDVAELLVDVRVGRAVDTAAVRLEVTTTETTAGLEIAVAPEEGWISDTIGDILTPDFCEAYLSSASAIGKNPAVWDYCAELLGL